MDYVCGLDKKLQLLKVHNPPMIMPQLNKKNLEYDLYDLNVFYSDDPDLVYRWTTPDITAMTLEKVLDPVSEITWDLISLNAQIRKLPKRIALLEAHGGYEKGNWCYELQGKLTSIQSWVTEHDGKYALIHIDSCNERGSFAYSKQSALIIPSNIFSLDRIDKNDQWDDYGASCTLDLWIPDQKFLSDDEEKEAVFHRLQEKYDTSLRNL